MSIPWVVLGILSWLVLAVLGAVAPRRHRGGDLGAALVYGLASVYVRLIQRVRYEGLEHVPEGTGPLVVVANHTAGVDPVLVQCGVSFEIRWMMARDMMTPALAEMWAFARVIPVDRPGIGAGAERAGGDGAAARIAIAELRRGGVVGVFPEGRIARPRGTIVPMQPGMGLLVSRTGARVLQAVITGTPDAPSAGASFFRRGRAMVRFLPPRDYTGFKPAEIIADVQARLVSETGWRVAVPPDAA